MKEYWINEIIVTITIFHIKKVLNQPKFETKSKLPINLYITGYPFSMYTIID